MPKTTMLCYLRRFALVLPYAALPTILATPPSQQEIELYCSLSTQTKILQMVPKDNYTFLNLILVSCSANSNTISSVQLLDYNFACNPELFMVFFTIWFNYIWPITVILEPCMTWVWGWRGGRRTWWRPASRRRGARRAGHIAIRLRSQKNNNLLLLLFNYLPPDITNGQRLKHILGLFYNTN